MKNIRQLTPISLSAAKISNGFWGERLRVNREITLPIEYKQCRDTGRIDAFKLEWKPGDSEPPHFFWDSDIAKWIEAAAYSITTHPDVELEKQVDDVIDLIAAAQHTDGYLNIHFTVVEPENRWKNLRSHHELYCAGHLMEAAVAWFNATGKRTLLETLCRYADYIDTVFGHGDGQIPGYPGHEEIELALVKLYHTTTNSRYLKMAEYFINERGQKPHYFDLEAQKRGENPADFNHGTYDYCQAHEPVREQDTAEGHAVRAGYLYAGMADVAAETGDAALLKACRAIWKNITEKRLYIHGGIGSSPEGERFTFDYDLPNEEAYAETCAAIALVFFAHRMLQLEPDSQYSDIMERALYNGIISGVSLDGKRFFYDNFLASIPETHKFNKRKPPVRQEWFGCACCPPNLARLLASLGQYVYSHNTDSIFVHLFVDGEAVLPLNGQDIKVIQQTEYPWDEDVKITVLPPEPATFTLALRIPGWCSEYLLSVNGEPISAPVEKGYLKLQRQWKPGDSIKLHLAMPVEPIAAHPAVRHNCGRVALQRGPVVYCLEEQDNGPYLNDIMLPAEAKFSVETTDDGIFKGIPLIRSMASRRKTAEWGNLYQATSGARQSVPVTAIPYFMWANRGEGEMLIWIRQAE